MDIAHYICYNFLKTDIYGVLFALNTLFIWNFIDQNMGKSSSRKENRLL